MYYKLEGKKIIEVTDSIEWGKWFATANRTVSFNTIGEIDISTVFLGLDHSFAGGEPLLFETMVFGGKFDGEMDRYSTWDKAERGHEAMKKRVIEGG